MPGVSIIADPNGFSGPVSQVLWDRKGGTALGLQINEDAPLRNRPTLFGCNGKPLTINKIGPVVRMKLNASQIDVNLAAGEAVITARYPPGSSLPDNTPIMLEFDEPVTGVGGYLSILGDISLYDGRSIHAIMWVLLSGDPEWKLSFGDGVTGRALLPASVPTTAFVGAQADAGAKITKVCFDASLAGNFDGLVLSRLYWMA